MDQQTQNQVPRSIPVTEDRFLVIPALLAGCLILAGSVSSLDHPQPALLYLPLGLGLALVVWFGRLGVIILAGVACLLPLLQALQHLLVEQGTITPALLFRGLWDPLLVAGLVTLGWWGYRHGMGGASRINEPRSAIYFLILFAGLVPALFGALQSGLGVLNQPPESFSHLWLRWSLSGSLSLLAVGAPLLILIPIRPVECAPGASRVSPLALVSLPGTPLETEGNTWGDILEIVGLTLVSAGLSSILLASRPRHGEDLLLWSTALLPIVWACLRQGLRGGMLAAGAAVVVPILVLPAPASTSDWLNLQAGLVGQSAIALLIGAAFTWVRNSEDRYRQVVGRVPVVLYTARIVEHTRIPRAEVTLVGDACSSLIGCQPEEFLGDFQRWIDQVHPADREVLQAALVQLTLQKQPVTCEYRLLSAENQPGKTQPPPRCFREILAPRLDSQGRLVGWDGVITDISEQRRLAESLRRTSSMFQVLVTNLPAGIFFVSAPNGQPVLVNARARQLLGKREEVSAGLMYFSTVYHLYRPDGHPYPVEELPVYQALKRGRTSMRDDIVVHRPDGQRIPLISWAAPVQLGGQAESDGAVWVLEDLTALHQAEMARRNSEIRLRAIIEAMGEGLLLLGLDGRILECNSASGRILQWEVEHLKRVSLGQLLNDLRDEEGNPIAGSNHPLVTCLKGTEPLRNVIVGYETGRGKGQEQGATSQRWLLINAMPMSSADSACCGVVLTMADITATRQAQEVLRHSEERYRELIESLPLMLVLLDRNLNIDYLNPATTRISGYQTEEVREVGRWMESIHPDDLASMRSALTRVLQGRTERYEFRYRATDHSIKHGLTLAEPRWHEGQVVGVTCLIVDLTRERQLEHELLHAQRMELIGRLSSGVAHDFNNLLTVVLSLSSLSQEDLPLDHPVRDNLRQISDASEQATALAGQLLMFSRQKPIEPQVVDIVPIAQKTLQMVQVLFATRVFSTLHADEAPVLVRADPTQIQQVLLNLCLNAGDAMPEGGRLTLTIRRDTETEAVRIIVEDEGVGIPEEVLGKIFEPFFTTKERGTGLGLFVVRQIVQGLGGTIQLTSTPGRGTRFEVAIPREPVPLPHQGLSSVS